VTSKWSIAWLLGAAILSPALARSQATNASAPYHAIAERNAFGLRALPPPAPAVSVEPLEDLLLSGLTDLAPGPCAFFTLAEPGKPPTYFNLREGEQNEWLEVRSVNCRQGTVKVVLKKPLARSRTIGVEVLLSFRADGREKRTVALNLGNPHVDVPPNP
jgi:hypothetical protein